MLSEGTSPQVVAGMAWVAHVGGWILQVTIRPSLDRVVQIVRSNLILVRRGGTNRPPTVGELELLLKRGQPTVMA
jgi:hypothetical protein